MQAFEFFLEKLVLLLAYDLTKQHGVIVFFYWWPNSQSGVKLCTMLDLFCILEKLWLSC